MADPLRRTWSVTAVDQRTTERGKIPRAVTGTGESEVAALRDLDDQLRGAPKPDGTRLQELLRRRLRLAYVEGAEESTLDHARRRMTGSELAGVVSRHRGT